MDTTTPTQAKPTGLLQIATAVGYRFRHAISLKQLAVKPTPKVRTDTVYRIRGVPRDWCEQHLRCALAEKYKSSDFAIGSLALEYHGESKTATINCRKGTSLPQDFGLPTEFAEGARVSLKADTGFHGITTLHSPPSKNHFVE